MIHIFVISNRTSRICRNLLLKNIRPTPSFERSGPAHYSSLPRSSGPRGATLRTFLLRSATQLIRTLAIVHVHVFSVDHIARLPALRAAAGRVRAWTTLSALSARASSRRVCLSRPASRLGALVELFSDLVQRAFQVLSSGAQSGDAALVD